MTRVLVVDDDARVAAAVRRALVYDGYAVEVASDGPSALVQVRDAPPDLVKPFVNEELLAHPSRAVLVAVLPAMPGQAGVPGATDAAFPGTGPAPR